MEKVLVENILRHLCQSLNGNLEKITEIPIGDPAYSDMVFLLLNEQLEIQSLIMRMLHFYAGSDPGLLAILDRGTFEIELIQLLGSNCINLSSTPASGNHL